METVVGGFKKSHFARIRAQNEISLEKNNMDRKGPQREIYKKKTKNHAPKLKKIKHILGPILAVRPCRGS